MALRLCRLQQIEVRGLVVASHAICYALQGDWLANSAWSYLMAKKWYCTLVSWLVATALPFACAETSMQPPGGTLNDIEDARPAKVHESRVSQGQTFVIRLNREDFDAHLIFQDSRSNELAFNNDDPAPDSPPIQNSKPVFAVPTDDSFRIGSTSFGSEGLDYGLMTEQASETEALADKAKQLNAEGVKLFQSGKLQDAAAKLSAALEIRRKLYPKGHQDLAISLHNLGGLLQAQGEYAKAEPYWRDALVMRQALYSKDRYPQGHPEVAESLNNLGGLLQAQGEYAKAEPYWRDALIMRQALYSKDRYPQGHPEVAESLNNLGVLLQSQGEYVKAEPYYRDALAIQQALYPKDRYPQGHPQLAISLNNLGTLLQLQGEYAKAEPYCRDTLAIQQALYPKDRYPQGHPQLAISLNNLGRLLQSQGEYAKAEPYYRDALIMKQALYPKDRYPQGHPDLAISLNNLGTLLQLQGEYAKAEPYCSDALAIQQALYPKDRYPQGHPQLAISLINLGVLLQSQGEYVKAEPYYRDALAMQQALYPKDRYPQGHSELATGLRNLGFLHQAQGEYAKALPYLEQALGIYHTLSTRETAKASEAQALAYRKAELGTRHVYLSVITHLAASAAAYDPLWHTRGDLLPLLQARHQGVLAQLDQSPGVRKDYDALVAVRRQIGRLQNEFANDPSGLKTRDQRLANLNDEQDRLENKLAAGLPEFKHLKELAAKGAADLARALPKDAAFVDVIRYTQWEKGKSTGRRYVAFMLLPGQAPKFIQLGNAVPIDAAASEWRGSIQAGQDSLAPRRLRVLVLDRIAKELPAATKRVYFCPDGDLARVPLAALPGTRKDTILLDEYAVAVVPSGPWLLQQLLYPAKPGNLPDRILAVGDVDYGQPAAKFQTLPGTARELKQVLDAFGQSSASGLAGAAASTDAVRDQLPKVRYAHLATHGYFNAARLSEERRRQQEQLQKFDLQSELGQGAGLGLRNPAGFTGLVLAGANAPATAGPDGGILTGLQVVDLPLEQLRLCVLSACETGLGELTEAEGVLGLQRAFHAAGCANVVGSLWPVDDEATAALMTQFYHELRANGRTPLEALRMAQLTLYRHPERIAALAGSSGPIAQAAAVKLSIQTEPIAPGREAKTTQVRLWAAFFLSGLGES